MNKHQKKAHLWLVKSEQFLEECHLINDTLEGIYGTKNKPSEELARDWYVPILQLAGKN